MFYFGDAVTNILPFSNDLGDKNIGKKDYWKAHRENRTLIIRVEVECLTVRRYVYKNIPS